MQEQLLCSCGKSDRLCKSGGQIKPQISMDELLAHAIPQKSLEHIDGVLLPCLEFSACLHHWNQCMEFTAQKLYFC